MWLKQLLCVGSHPVLPSCPSQSSWAVVCLLAGGFSTSTRSLQLLETSPFPSPMSLV